MAGMLGTGVERRAVTRRKVGQSTIFLARVLFYAKSLPGRAAFFVECQGIGFRSDEYRSFPAVACHRRESLLDRFTRQSERCEEIFDRINRINRITIPPRTIFDL